MYFINVEGQKFPVYGDVTYDHFWRAIPEDVVQRNFEKLRKITMDADYYLSLFGIWQGEELDEESRGLIESHHMYDECDWSRATEQEEAEAMMHASHLNDNIITFIPNSELPVEERNDLVKKGYIDYIWRT